MNWTNRNEESIPLLAEEGRLRGQIKVAKPPCSAQTGAKRERASAKPKSGQFGGDVGFRRSDHPVRSFQRRLRDIFLMSRPPLLCEEGNIA
jgi:hypothetical protein